MIVFTLLIEVPPEQKANTVDLFESVAGIISVQPGNESINMYYQMYHQNELLLVSKWKSFEYLEHHIQSEPFRKILAMIDLAIKEPEVKFYNVSSTRGFELIEKIKG
ncbi:MAG: antibiotic biosynthesis monooxygenase [Desulfobacteraceae bacterium]|nr:antibiotic biosynthesis monooxygenase [Desulfobacteraceae bacterium]MCF8094052.1 antibiotic biosynthesis monooxygenase [Desulfobacteraceae bacterium]